MKKEILLLTCLFCMLIARPTTYYFSSRGNDSNNGTSESTPFQTLSKLNSLKSSLKAGDRILFNRGDIFTGNMMVTDIKGSASAPITFGAYGTGADPIISGFTPVTGWKNEGNGLYAAEVSTSLTSCNVVTMDGAFEPMGKMPKGNSGYYTVGEGSTTSAINSKDLAGLPSYVGGEIVWRPFEFTLWRGTVTAQSSSNVSFTAFPSTSGGNVQNPQTGFGFFFQNAPAACTQLGEWAFNSNSKELTMYFGTAGPGNHVVKAVTTDILINASGAAYVTFANLSLQGGNTYVMTGTNASNITFDNCSIFGAGVYGLFGNGTCPNWTISNCKITYCNSVGMRASTGSSAWTVTGNTLNQIGNFLGMGGSGEGEYFGMRDMPANSTVTYNTVTNMGYVGINLRGNNTLVQYNFLDTTCTIKQDGSAIYFGGDFNSGSRVLNNVILHCFGNKAGTTSDDLRGYGIYADDGTNGVEIAYNTSSYNGNAGLYIHGGYNLNVHDNTFYYNGVSSIKYYNDMNSIANITFTRNTCFALNEPVVYSSGGNQEAKNFFASSDNNVYARPTNENNIFQTTVPSGSYNLSSWQSYTAQEKNSKGTNGTTQPVRFEYNSTKDVKQIALDGTYIDMSGNSVTTLTLQPYSSAVLIYSASSQTYYNAVMSAPFTRNNCPGGTVPSTITYSVAAGTYSSTVSQADADSKAQADINTNGQTYANQNGACSSLGTYSSNGYVKTFTKNNCSSGNGSIVRYTVPAGKYVSVISQADADSKALADIDANGQNYANTVGQCNLDQKQQQSAQASSQSAQSNRNEIGVVGQAEKTTEYTEYFSDGSRKTSHPNWSYGVGIAYERIFTNRSSFDIELKYRRALSELFIPGATPGDTSHYLINENFITVPILYKLTAFISLSIGPTIDYFVSWKDQEKYGASKLQNYDQYYDQTVSLGLQASVSKKIILGRLVLEPMVYYNKILTVKRNYYGGAVELKYKF